MDNLKKISKLCKGELFVKQISRFYPLTQDLIDSFHNILDWKKILLNRNLKLSDEYFKDLLQDMDKHPDYPWVEKEIDGYTMFRDVFDAISGSKRIKWNLELIEKFKYKIDWDELSKNDSLNFDILLLETYKEKWNWKYLSKNSGIKWSIELIDRYKEKWDWNYLTNNENITWTDDLISYYLEDLKKENVWNDFSGSSRIEWSSDLLNKYNWDIHWLAYSESFPWDEKFIEEHKDELSFDGLSRNKSLPWSIELIEKYKEHWEWWCLALNESLPWNIPFVEKYFKDFDINWYQLSYNNKIPWTKDFILSYESFWRSYDASPMFKYNNVIENLSINKGLFNSFFKNLSEETIHKLLSNLNSDEEDDVETYRVFKVRETTMQRTNLPVIVFELCIGWEEKVTENLVSCEYKPGGTPYVIPSNYIELTNKWLVAEKNKNLITVNPNEFNCRIENRGSQNPEKIFFHSSIDLL